MNKIAILKHVPIKDRGSGSLKAILDYVKNGHKTKDETLLWGKDCRPEKALEDMEMTKKLFHKTGGRQYAHFIHSFDVNDAVSPELALEIGQKFVMSCPQFQDFQVLATVHTDKEHIHLHYVANSVSHKDGHKWQFRVPKDLEEMRGISDEICREYGLSVIEKRGKFNMHYGEYNNPNAWKYKLSLDVRDCLAYSRNWEEFSYELAEKGVQMTVLEPNLGGHTVLFSLDEEYCGQKDGRECSSNKLSNYGDFSYENMNKILAFNALNAEADSWDDEVLYSFLETFDDSGEFYSLSMEHGIEWKSLCWLEIQMIIGQMKTRQKENQVRNDLIREKNEDKEKFNLILTCSEEWLDYFRSVQEQVMEDDWDR